jgi:hypothetical protein
MGPPKRLSQGGDARAHDNARPDEVIPVKCLAQARSIAAIALTIRFTDTGYAVPRL